MSEMYVICYKEVPADLSTLHRIEKKLFQDDCSKKGNRIIANRTKQGAIKHFLYYFGYTWKERNPDIECVRADLIYSPIHNNLKAQYE